MKEPLIFVLGLALGSFLNVCIYRLPRGESLLHPRSFCPKCGKKVRWFDNVPLLSFVLLRGRCRDCRDRISFQYPLVEFLGGVVWWVGWRVYGNTPLFWINGIFLSWLLVVSFVDLETGLIPDTLTFWGIGAGLAASLVYPELHSECGTLVSTPLICALLQSAGGLVAGGALIYLMGVLGNWIFQRESMGGGDVKLLAMIGVFLGLQKVCLTFFTAPFFALPFALYRRFIKKEEIIPYGPFLSLAAGIQFLYGDWFWKLFMRL